MLCKMNDLTISEDSMDNWSDSSSYVLFGGIYINVWRKALKVMDLFCVFKLS